MKIAQLHKLFLECNSVCTDTRKLKKGDIFFALKGDNFNGNLFAENAISNGAKYAVIDEKEYESKNTILVENVLYTLQELATFHRQYLKIPIIALTGSNGKTTTKELINVTLSQKFNTTATIGNLNNHIGVPLTLLSMNRNNEIGIVEMGANHLKEIELLCSIAQPDYGYITNFGKAHLEGFGGVEGVIQGKSEMYRYLIKNKKTIFVNSEDPIQVEKSKGAKTYSFGKDNVKSDAIINLIDANPNVKVGYNDIEIQSNLIGEYNFSNISAAIAIGQYFKIDPEKIKAAIESYTPDNNRSQIIKKGSNTIILDAYNANPTSMSLALKHFSKIEASHKVAILGDMFELGESSMNEHQYITDFVSALDIDSAFLVGDHFSETKTKDPKVSLCKSFEILKERLEGFKIKNSYILVKGSRGMALERVVDILK